MFDSTACNLRSPIDHHATGLARDLQHREKHMCCAAATQREGLQFMWRNLWDDYNDTTGVQEEDRGGVILAHTMVGDVGRCRGWVDACAKTCKSACVTRL